MIELLLEAWLLTTRLDSDDAIARDFMAAVQREFIPTDGLFVDFPRGDDSPPSDGPHTLTIDLSDRR